MLDIPFVPRQQKPMFILRNRPGAQPDELHAVGKLGIGGRFAVRLIVDFRPPDAIRASDLRRALHATLYHFDRVVARLG